MTLSAALKASGYNLTKNGWENGNFSTLKTTLSGKYNLDNANKFTMKHGNFVCENIDGTVTTTLIINKS